MRRLPLGSLLTLLAACSFACAGEQERTREEEEDVQSDAAPADEDDDQGDDDVEGDDDEPDSRDGSASDPRDGSTAGAVDAARPAARDAGLADAESNRSDASLAPNTDAGGSKSDASTDAAVVPRDAGPGDAGAFSRAFHIPLRVHRARSSLSGMALASILEEVNEIWWKQAAICFEIEVVRSEEVRRDGFDLWFHQSGLGCGANANGVYCGDHDIHSLDAPSLNRADNAQWDTRQNPARTGAHELGHGLNLDHYNGYPDSNDSLMSSGRQGFKLHEMEIATARRRAEMKALPDSSASPCAPVPVVN